MVLLIALACSRLLAIAPADMSLPTAGDRHYSKKPTYVELRSCSLTVFFSLFAVCRVQVQRIARKVTGLTALNLDRCSVGDVGVRALSSLTKLEVRRALCRRLLV